ncbi:hypothetical protein Agub_g10985, partial [Astrephomene gubernaculifera]
MILHPLTGLLFLVLVGQPLIACATNGNLSDVVRLQRQLDPSYRPPPIWGCEEGLPAGAFHVVVATYAPEPMALVPWIWNLGLAGAQIWIYHRLDSADPRLASASAALAALEPYPCNSTIHLQQLIPNKGREAAVYLSHIVRHYNNLPEGLALIHDHGPAARHSLCGPFFRRLRGYYAGIREQLLRVQSRTHRKLQTEQRTQEAGGTAAVATRAEKGGRGSSGGGGSRGTEGRPRPANSTTSSSKGRSGGGSGSAAQQLFAKFAERVVSLSSGCQENWLKGCCALLVCSEDSEQAGGAAEAPWDSAGGAVRAAGGAAGGGSATAQDETTQQAGADRALLMRLDPEEQEE